MRELLSKMKKQAYCHILGTSIDCWGNTGWKIPLKYTAMKHFFIIWMLVDMKIFGASLNKLFIGRLTSRKGLTKSCQFILRKSIKQTFDCTQRLHRLFSWVTFLSSVRMSHRRWTINSSKWWIMKIFNHNFSNFASIISLNRTVRRTCPYPRNDNNPALRYSEIINRMSVLSGMKQINLNQSTILSDLRANKSEKYHFVYLLICADQEATYSQWQNGFGWYHLVILIIFFNWIIIRLTVVITRSR